jgi:D-lactate dehydrogenase (cytochrome)
MALPDGVVFAESEEDVIAAVRLCARHNVPLVPFAIGSSVEGHVLPIFGGISLDVRRMNRITAVNANDMDATVEPGVTRTELNAHLRDTGLFFSVDPGANATIGGMAATRASGTNAVRYGTMREVVTSLRVVLADGRAIHTGTRARKSAAGYDLTRLFVGSEGTLGVITSVTVRLFPRPDKVSAAVVSFPDLKSAGRSGDRHSATWSRDGAHRASRRYPNRCLQPVFENRARCCTHPVPGISWNSCIGR